MSVENTDTFGNYLIQGIDEIILPEPVSWWPSAAGWKILAAILVLWFIYVCARWLKYQWRNRYRRVALRQLNQLQKQAGNNLQAVVAQLPYFIKVTALQTYPRHQVASLSGRKWLAFLDAHYSGPPFSTAMGEKLLAIAYLPQDHWQLTDIESRTLIEMSRHWIKTHREDERRR